MSKKNLKISYDKDSEVLSVEVPGVKSVDSDISGNVVIDYDKSGNVSRVNFYSFDFREFRNRIGDIRKFAQKARATFSFK